jgi:hypothetical protein
MNLLELQRRMAEDVRRPLTADYEMQALAENGRPMCEIASSYVKPTSVLSSAERLEIYNRQYWFRVIGAVSEDFPALSAVLGADTFDALVVAYLRENPSTSFTLRNLGARLPTWLASYPEFAGSRHRLAIDVARLEWAYVEAFDGASLPPLALRELAGLGTDSTLRLQPHLQLLDLLYPVDEVVLAVRKGSPETDITSNASSERQKTPQSDLPEVAPERTYLAVHRLDNSVYYRRIEREQFLLLANLRDGDSIAAAVGDAFAGCELTQDEEVSKVHEYFSHAAELGWLCLSDSAMREPRAWPGSGPR